MAGGPGPCHHCRDVHGKVILPEHRLCRGRVAGPKAAPYVIVLWTLELPVPAQE